MNSTLGILPLLVGMLFTLCGCAVGDKSAGEPTLYFTAGVLSLLLLGACLLLIRRQRRYMILLFVSICIVNAGYCWLSIAPTLGAALNANRLAYLGSVFLPMSMLLLILDVSKVRIPRALPFLLTGLSLAVFLIAASPGILPLYYSDVWLETVDGVSTLHKVYGPWHSLYLFYLLGYFTAMTVAVVRAARKHLLDSVVHVVFLAIAAFINIGVWFIEQLVDIRFELLSVSYIISELFLLGLCLMLQENDKRLRAAVQSVKASTSRSAVTAVDITPELRHAFLSGLPTLTATERLVYDGYVQGKTSKQLLEELDIKENTLKYHNRNIYSKLGINSRKQLLALAADCQQDTP